MKLKIECYGNIDHGQNPYELTAKKEIEGENIQDIRGKVYDFQAKNQIGGGNWGECPLYLHGVLIGYMSFNGTVWDRSDSDRGRKEEIDDTLF